MPSPSDAFSQAVAYHQAGNLAEAESRYRAALVQNPAYAEAHANLGVLLARSGRVEEAVRHYQAALEIKPAYAEAHYNLGNALRRLGRPADAAGCYERALLWQPRNVSALCNLGLCYSELRQFERAVTTLQEALRCDSQFADGYPLLATALQRAGRMTEAIEAFRHYTRLRPDEPRGYNNLALALMWQGDLDESIAALRQALLLKPDYTEAHNNLGLAFERQGQPDESVAEYEAAVRCNPNSAESQNNLGNAYSEQGRIDEALPCMRRAVALQPRAAHLHSNLLLTLNYQADLAPEALLQEHLAWARQHLPTPPVAPPQFKCDRQPGRKLRIGYLSADFRQHTVASYLEPVLAAHDRTQFHIIAYANVNRPDAVTERLKGYVDAWRDLSQTPDAEAARLIREDAVDILIDLGGHTASNRLLLMHERAAPVQATHFGYPNTTAVPAIDYRLSDPQADPPGQSERFYTERIFRLPEVAWCYRPGTEAPVAELPATSAGHLTFGSFNNLAKVNDQVIALWARVLRATPGSRLWLMRGRAAQGVGRAIDTFARHGIAADRLELVARCPAEEYFRLYDRVDLCLDPFPYNGGVTTCDALWMGVPVIALAGATYVARQGVRLLTHLGLAQYVAPTPDEYVEIATRNAVDLPALAEIRRGLRSRMQASLLVDAARFARQLEAGYRQMWDAWAQG